MFNENGADPFNQGSPESGDVPAFDGNPSLGQQGYSGETSMVSDNGTEEEVIVMENVGPLRAWWNNQSPATKLTYKALGVGALIFAGKYAVSKAIDGIKKKGKEELQEELEEEIENIESEE